MKRRETENHTGVDITCTDPNLPVDLQRLAALARTVCERFGRAAAQVSIAIVDDAEIRRVNEQFLASMDTTDVISFDLSDAGAAAFDLVVNADEALRQSLQRGHSAEAELALYVAHGLLHQLGYDDADAQEAERMHAAEDALLDAAGFGKVYSHRESGESEPEGTAQ